MVIDIFSGFSLGFIYPGPGTGEAGTQKQKWTQTKDQDRGSLARQKTMDSGHPTLTKYHRENGDCNSAHISKVTVESLPRV